MNIGVILILVSLSAVGQTQTTPSRVPSECKVSSGSGVTVWPCMDFEAQNGTGANRDTLYGSVCAFQGGSWKRGVVYYDQNTRRQTFTVQTVCDKGITTMSPIVVDGPRLAHLNLDNGPLQKTGNNVVSRAPQGISSPTICYTSATRSFGGTYLPGAPMDCTSSTPCVFINDVANPPANMPLPTHTSSPLALSGSFWVRKYAALPDADSQICVGGVRRN